RQRVGAVGGRAHTPDRIVGVGDRGRAVRVGFACQAPQIVVRVGGDDALAVGLGGQPPRAVVGEALEGATSGPDHFLHAVPGVVLEGGHLVPRVREGCEVAHHVVAVPRD